MRARDPVRDSAAQRARLGEHCGTLRDGDGLYPYRESIPGTVDGSSSVGIVVLDLADGSRVAVGVYCGVGPCQVVAR